MYHQFTEVKNTKEIKEFIQKPNKAKIKIQKIILK